MFRFLLAPDAELRLLEDRHAEPLFQLVDRNRTHLRPWFHFVDATHSADDSRAFIQRSLQKFASQNGFDAGIWFERALAGVIQLLSIDWTDKRAAIGYWLGEEFQGRGLAPRACSAVLDHAFAELGLHRIEIRCAPANRRSRAIPERLGFTQEGILRGAVLLHGRFEDSMIYAMLDHEWAAREQQRDSA